MPEIEVTQVKKRLEDLISEKRLKAIIYKILTVMCIATCEKSLSEVDFTLDPLISRWNIILLSKAEMYGLKDKNRRKNLIQKEAIYGCCFIQTVNHCYTANAETHRGYIGNLE